MTPERRPLPRLVRTSLVGAALILLPAQLLAQEVNFERLWSYDTGG